MAPKRPAAAAAAAAPAAVLDSGSGSDTDSEDEHDVVAAFAAAAAAAAAASPAKARRVEERQPAAPVGLRRFYWTKDLMITMYHLAAREDIFAARYGQVGAKWQAITDGLNEAAPKETRRLTVAMVKHKLNKSVQATLNMLKSDGVDLFAASAADSATLLAKAKELVLDEWVDVCYAFVRRKLQGTGRPLPAVHQELRDNTDDAGSDDETASRVSGKDDAIVAHTDRPAEAKDNVDVDEEDAVDEDEEDAVDEDEKNVDVDEKNVDVDEEEVDVDEEDVDEDEEDVDEDEEDVDEQDEKNGDEDEKDEQDDSDDDGSAQGDHPHHTTTNEQLMHTIQLLIHGQMATQQAILSLIAVLLAR